MRHRFAQAVTDIKEFQSKALFWADYNFQTVCYLDNNEYPGHQYATYDTLIGIGEIDAISCKTGHAFERLKSFQREKSDWLFGFLGYDLKNEIESLSSVHPDYTEFPDLYFFQPKHVLKIRNNIVTIYSMDNDPSGIFNQILHTQPYVDRRIIEPVTLKSRFSKAHYIHTVENIRTHMAKGDVYELNLCMEFYGRMVHANPLELFNRLNKISKAPFSAYFKSGDKYLICASPERFLKKMGDKLISQPIKGTMHRGRISGEDEMLKNILRGDPKERAENMMIVDLVRNDLARSCVPSSVTVEELFEVKTFEQVHQLVSTISGRLKEDVHFIDAIKNAFPMGSMTGAPKIKSMELIEKYERTKRGLYSGALGYITPGNDFDFNVVIRSMIYNREQAYLSFQVGSAITYNSVPEREYEECMLKARGMRQAIDSLDVKPVKAIPL